MNRTSQTLSLLGACALALLACGPARTTQRVFDGHTVNGPYVEPEAYAAFAEGVYLEERGDLQGAIGAYRRAQERDPDSPSIAARIGAVLCPSGLSAALDALGTSDVASDYAPAWVERARCLRRHERAPEALAAARRAVALAPGSAGANLLVTQLFRETGDPKRARVWLLGWVTSEPSARAHRAEIVEQARLLGDDALAAWVDEQSFADPGLPAEDLRGPARRGAAAAQPAKVAAATRGLAAARVQATAIGRRPAALALLANPGDASALVEALSSAWFETDHAAFRELLRLAAPSAPPPADVASRMTELLRLCVGDAAAQDWAAAYERVTAAR